MVIYAGLGYVKPECTLLAAIAKTTVTCCPKQAQSALLRFPGFVVSLTLRNWVSQRLSNAKTFLSKEVFWVHHGVLEVPPPPILFWEFDLKFWETAGNLM